jgi:serine/threonine protein kinase
MTVEGDFRTVNSRDRTLPGWASSRPSDELRGPKEGAAAGYALGVRLYDSGEIYEGYHPRFSGDLIIKLFRRGVSESSATVKDFSREAGRVSILSHPHIAKVLDSGILADNTPFAAMERLSGRSLEEYLVDQGPLSTTDVLSIVRGIVSGLSAAHNAGIVHREIRPDNVFLVDGIQAGPGFVKLLDFGVSRLTWGGHSAGRGVSVVASCYLAPEQVRGNLADIDHRTDQFAVAALAYRLLTGSEPFAGYAAGTGGAYPMPRPVIASMGARSAVDVVLLKALSVRSSDRFRSVGVFYDALEQALTNTAPVGSSLVATEEQERPGPLATAAADVDDIDDVDDPDFDADVVDKIPKQRGSLVAVAMIATVAVAVFAVGKLGWRPSPVWRQVNIPLTFLALGWANPENADPQPAPAGRQAVDPAPAAPGQSPLSSSR